MRLKRLSVHRIGYRPFDLSALSGQLRRATLASSDALRDALLTHCIVLADETPLQMLTSGAKKLIELLSETMPLVGSPT